MPVIPPLEEFPKLLTAIDGCEKAPFRRDRQTRLALQKGPNKREHNPEAFCSRTAGNPLARRSIKIKCVHL
jgi:hypothetical protein